MVHFFRRSTFTALLILVLALVALTGCGKSSDATLASLSLSSNTLTPTFSPSTYDYVTVYLVAADTTSYSATITATPNEPLATMKYRVGTGAWTTLAPGVASTPYAFPRGQNLLSILVTAPNGAMALYTVQVTVMTFIPI